MDVFENFLPRDKVFSCDEEPPECFIENEDTPMFENMPKAIRYLKSINPNDSQSPNQQVLKEPQHFFDETQEKNQFCDRDAFLNFHSKCAPRKDTAEAKPLLKLEGNIESAPSFREKVSKSNSQNSLKLRDCFQNFIDELDFPERGIPRDFIIFAMQKATEIGNSVTNYYKAMHSKQGDQIVDNATAALDKDFRAFLKRRKQSVLLNFIKPRPNYLPGNEGSFHMGSISLPYSSCSVEQINVGDYQPPS